jgi:hypothetical protein
MVFVKYDSFVTNNNPFAKNRRLTGKYDSLVTAWGHAREAVID